MEEVGNNLNQWDSRNKDEQLGDVFVTTLHRLASGPSLHLHHVPQAWSRFCLSEWATTLRTLHVEVELGSGLRAEAVPPSLARSIVAATGLETLVLKFSEEDEGAVRDIPLEAFSEVFSSVGGHPSLKHLTLISPLLSSPILRLAESLAPSLHTLRLTRTQERVHEFDSFHGVVFPHLRSLSIHGYHIKSLYPSILPASFPSLQNLELVPIDWNPSVRKWLEPVLATIGKQLVTLRVHEGARLRPSQALVLEELCASINPDLVAFDYPDVPVYPSHELLIRPDNLAPADRPSCRPFVESLSDFLTSEVRQAQRNDDEASFVNLALAMRGLELERMARIG
jgi:hypothetical protein